MDTHASYQMGVSPVNSSSTAVTGRWLADADLSPHEAAFVAADLVTGDKFLTEPTRTQAAALAGTDRISLYWALQRAPFREEILAGTMPLVPAGNGNGNGGDSKDRHASFKAHLTALINPEALAALASIVGADRWLEAAEIAGL